MITVSVCMIVKNEANILKRCLDSLRGIYDELIIVDTGSNDDTKKIAAEYTDKIFDFEWIDDFSAARNYSMQMASSDYIYIADADEILDEENRQKFLRLKECMDPCVEIVEMRYVNQLENGTVYNFDSEYRPKLYKRLREFTFIDPIHEVVRLDPVVFESDIDIIHKPENLHSSRDISIFEKMIKEGKELSLRLLRMYARELLISGTTEEYKRAAVYFNKLLNEKTGVDSSLHKDDFLTHMSEQDMDYIKLCHIIIAMNAANEKDEDTLKTIAEENMKYGGCSEICSILGAYFELAGDFKEAKYWYECAVNETAPEVAVRYGDQIPKNGLDRL